MKIAVCTAWGNDPSVIRMIESIPKDWDIFLVEGRFSYSKLPEFCDLELVKKVMKFPNVKILHRSGLEFDVRNRYLEEMKGYDFALMLDTDEHIIEYDHVDFENSVKDLKESYHLIDVLYNGQSKQQGRFFVKPFNWRYHNSHKYITNGKIVKAVFEADSMIKGIKVIHDDSIRSKELQETIEEYQQHLWKLESGRNLRQEIPQYD